MAASYPNQTSAKPDTSSTPTLVMDGVSFGYTADQPLIDNFNWSITAGSRWAMLGPSGSGKTTLLYLLAGLRQPTAGQVYYNGSPLTKPHPEIGLMLQAYGLLPWYTAHQNIEVGLKIRGLPADERQQRSARWLERLNITAATHQFPNQLSGGQRQRVALARLLALETRVLLLDEPLSAVDELTRERLQSRLRSLQTELAATLVLVTHSVEEAAMLADHVLIINEHLPISTAAVLHSPFNGTAPDRSDPEFIRFCAALRRELEI